MKHFLVILGLTALVWLGVTLSEPIEYPLHVDVELTGYDTVKYAILQADTSATVTIETKGYSVLLNNLWNKKTKVVLPLQGDGTHHAVGVDELQKALRSTISGIQDIHSDVDSLYFTLAERCSRQYRPNIEHVKFSFSEQYGLYGQPVISPEVITLYGPEEELDKIKEVYVSPSKIENISQSGKYRLPLEAPWTTSADIRSSCDMVEIYLPVEAYVEREYDVPIRVANADTTVQLRLYPSSATLHVWVAQRDLQKMPEFDISIDYNDIQSHKQHIHPQLTSFPEYMRPRNIEPEEVQCVIIK